MQQLVKGFTRMLLAFSVCIISVKSAYALPQEFSPLMINVQVLFIEEKYDELDKLLGSWNTPTERTPSGAWKLEAATFGLEYLFGDQVVSTFPSNLKKVNAWKKRNPKSPGAAIAEGILWVEYAKSARGSGYASTVTKEGWALFRTRMQASEKALSTSKGYASINPMWYTAYLNVARGLNWSHQENLAVFEEATKKHKLYIQFYKSAAYSLTPRWGGSYPAVEQFAQWAADSTKEEVGYSMYTNIYTMMDNLARSDYENIFETTAISWNTAKKGFEDTITKYPTQMNINRYASFACRAKDKSTYLKVRNKITKIDIDSWPENISIEICDTRFLSKT